MIFGKRTRTIEGMVCKLLSSPLLSAFGWCYFYSISFDFFFSFLFTSFLYSVLLISPVTRILNFLNKLLEPKINFHRVFNSIISLRLYMCSDQNLFTHVFNNYLYIIDNMISKMCTFYPKDIQVYTFFG